MDKLTVFFVLLSMIVASVYGQCSCQTKPPINVIYEGEGCECGRKYPVQVEVPKITEHRDAHYDYGFTIENPQQPSKPAEVRYSFDFHLEKPQPPPSSASLATYGFQVETPPQKLEEQPPKLYRFDYQVQTPVTNVVNGGNVNLQDLSARVDRVVMQNLEEQPPKLYRFDYQVQTPVTNVVNGGNVNLQDLSARVDRVVMQNLEEQPPKLYRFDYQVQTPVTNVVNGGNVNLQGLLATVDRVVMQKPDCAKSINGCKCNSYKPTPDILQSCPKHGHLYQSKGPLDLMNQQRYYQESNLQQQNPDQQVSTSVDRSKRDITHKFPIKIKEMLPGLGLPSKNQVRKISSEDENEKRVSEIMKTNFGIDPNENVDDLLTPKQFSLQSIPSESHEVQDLGIHEVQDHIKLKTPDFVAKITPKIQEARTNMKSRIAKIVNQARLNAIKMNSMIQKRSTDINSSDVVDVDLNNANDDGSNKSIQLPAHSEQSDIVKVNSENVNRNDQSRRERVRKHCDRCGELAMKYPCPSCAEASLAPSQPQYIEMRQGNPVPFVPRNSNARQTSNHNTQPRYVFDRFGHRYLEHNGKLKLIGPEQNHDDVTVGSYQSDAAYSEVEDIIDRNSELIHKTNRRVGEGHLLQPLNLAHATDAIRFIQELTQQNNDQYNEDYYSNGNSYVGRPLAKRSFQIVPLAEDTEDGSVLVKILPTRLLSKNENKKFDPETRVSTEADAVNSAYLKPSIEENIFGKEKTDVKPNFDKIIRDGKKYEILALSANGSDEESVGSDEDMEIVKYIYAANYREQAEGNPSTKLNDSKNDETSAGSQLEI